MSSFSKGDFVEFSLADDQKRFLIRGFDKRCVAEVHEVTYERTDREILIVYPIIKKSGEPMVSDDEFYCVHAEDATVLKNYCIQCNRSDHE